MISIKKSADLSGHSGPVYALEFAGTEDHAFSAGSDRVVAKWNLPTGAPEKFTASLPGIVYSLKYLHEKGLLFAGTSEGKIHIIDLYKKQELKALQHHSGPVFDVQCGQGLLLSAGGDGNLGFVSLETLQAIKVLKLCNEKIRGIDISGSTAAVACGDGIIRILNIETQQLLQAIDAHKGSVYAVKFSADGSSLLSGGKDAHLKEWKMEASSGLSPSHGKWNMGRSIPAHNYAIYSIVFNQNGNYFATASRDKTVKIWDSTTFEVLVRINHEQYKGHQNSVNKILWGKQLVSAGDDRKVMVWETN